MNKSQLERAIRQAFPNALLLSIEQDGDLTSSDGSPFFSGVLADASFDDESESERFGHFLKALAGHLNGSARPNVRLRLLSAKDYNSLTGLVA